jgi:hypothetical protein
MVGLIRGPRGEQRIAPNLPARDYVTFRIDSPTDRLVRTACEDAGCIYWGTGWESRVDESTPEGASAATWIRRTSGRTFTERRDGGVTVFRFAAHQRCFQNHMTRPETFLRLGGDWRGNPLRTPPRRHQRAADWVEDMGLHLRKISDEQKRG